MKLCEQALAKHLATGGAALIASHEALPALTHRVMPLTGSST
jgi:ABC-type transport system involved in cytochrome c biogenesis ATPase subunit